MKVLIARPDSAGDVLLAEPAIRAVANHAEVDLLVSEQGRAAAELIPRVKRLLVHQLPWIDADPSPVTARNFDLLIADVKEGHYDQAIILTSFHQSALPLALALRLAGVSWIAARSEDYPGSLLDLRFRGDDDVHEVVRSIQLVAACGYRAPSDMRLRIKELLRTQRPTRPYLVLHPGGSAPSRRWDPIRWRDLARRLADRYEVLVTGSAGEVALAEFVADGWAHSVAGKTSFAQLAALISDALCVISGNTSAVHLASATHTPVVELFAPVVPAHRWGPWLTPHLVLGDQDAPCRDTRVRECHIDGHPCLNSLTAEEVYESALYLIGEV